MPELMLDLETLDTKASAVVLSIGAVVWETEVVNAPDSVGTTRILEEFEFALNLQEQFDAGRTVSESTLLWWMWQEEAAQYQAFRDQREGVKEVHNMLAHMVSRYPYLNRFWAGPATFDFPIWESLMETFSLSVPWTYRQRYDLRTAVNETGYSVDDHISAVEGVAHTPVFDCLKQIDLLNAARNHRRRKRS